MVLSFTNRSFVRKRGRIRVTQKNSLGTGNRKGTDVLSTLLTLALTVPSTSVVEDDPCGDVP